MCKNFSKSSPNKWVSLLLCVGFVTKFTSVRSVIC